MPQARLGELLVLAGLLTEEKLRIALREQERTGVRLGQVLVDHRIVQEDRLYDVLAKVAGLERLDLETTPLEPKAMQWVTGPWALEHGVAPLYVDTAARALLVAVADPTNVGPLDELSFRSGLRVKAILGTELEVQQIVRSHFYGEALDRQRRRRISRPVLAGPVEEDGSPEILHGMSELREDLQAPEPLTVFATRLPRDTEPAPPSRRSTIPAPSSALPAPSLVPEASAELDPLAELIDRQEGSALELQALFELCIEKGLLRRQEYLERLERIPD